jgi:predicted metal-dependent HD superfamily phosphohydrolase
MTASRPAELAARLSFDAPASMLERLAARYAEPHRHYHTWAHVLACFEARDLLTRAASPEVDLALLFHDAVYAPLARDNEDVSADLLVEEGRRAWLDDAMLLRARALVAVTKHDAEPTGSEEACIVVDADLSILGAEVPAFDAYERNVRVEYAAVPNAAYAAGRRAVLEGFLARPAIYATRRGQTLWEARARANLTASLARLGEHTHETA